MKFSSSYLAYTDTHNFSNWVTDYLSGEEALRPFYQHIPNLNGLADAIAARRKINTNRSLLVEKFSSLYLSVSTEEAVKKNILLLNDENCFTICAAHQPHLFTGPLYVVYKILHAIKLATYLNEKFPSCHFVPVYVMGSEDADLDELGNIRILGKAYSWQTHQTGAVGRMEVDEALVNLIETLELDVKDALYGTELVQTLKKCFTSGKSIAQATFELVHMLFGKYGLLVFMPDDVGCKKEFAPFMQREILASFSFECVSNTLKELPEKYTAQVTPREINLFYMDGGVRERIIKTATGYQVNHTDLFFNEMELIELLDNHPERFSPNVILRPLYQEFILPNVAFVGGGSELAYWMQLKDLFKEAGIPYPVLVLRNSFLCIDHKINRLIEKLQLNLSAFFKDIHELEREWIASHMPLEYTLLKEQEEFKDWYAGVVEKAKATDPTLTAFALSIEKKMVDFLFALEEKMLRAEKKKQEVVMRQLHKIKSHTHPHGLLQERSDSFISYFLMYGPAFITAILDHSLALEMNFSLLAEDAQEIR